MSLPIATTVIDTGSTTTTATITPTTIQTSFHTSTPSPPPPSSSVFDKYSNEQSNSIEIQSALLNHTTTAITTTIPTNNPNQTVNSTNIHQRKPNLPSLSLKIPPPSPTSPTHQSLSSTPSLLKSITTPKSPLQILFSSATTATATPPAPPTRSTSVMLSRTPKSRPQLYHRLGKELPAVLLIGLFIGLLSLCATPFHRGFNCDDDSIRYPYKEDTITPVKLFAMTSVITIFTICVNEHFVIKQLSKKKDDEQEPPNRYIPQLGWQTYTQSMPLMFATAASMCITFVSKYAIGRLRPHFIDFCQPQIYLPTGEQIIITRTTKCEPAIDPQTYWIDYQCKNSNATNLQLLDSHQSFMSGHSSHAAVVMVYLAIYVQIRVQYTVIGYLKPFYQLFLIALAFYTGLSRVSDYKHHWSDVLTGLVQGSITAALVARYMANDLWTWAPPTVPATNLDALIKMMNTNDDVEANEMYSINDNGSGSGGNAIKPINVDGGSGSVGGDNPNETINV